jgi:DNA-binding XRE family transcriptional regulator
MPKEVKTEQPMEVKMKNNICKWRNSNFFTQKFVASSIGYSLCQYNKIEKGTTSDIKLSAAISLANLFQCSLFELFNIESESTRLPIPIWENLILQHSLDKMQFEMSILLRQMKTNIKK